MILRVCVEACNNTEFSPPSGLFTESLNQIVVRTTRARYNARVLHYRWSASLYTSAKLRGNVHKKRITTLCRKGMNRRQYLSALAGSTVLLAGCLDSFGDTDRNEDEVFAGYRYSEHDLIVEFHDDVEVETARLLGDRSTEKKRVERPIGTVRFPVVFPQRLDTHLPSRPPIRVEAETEGGTARTSVWEPIHGAVRNLEPGPDGKAHFHIKNEGTAPLLVRFVSVHGDVSEPATDPTSDEFDLNSFRGGPGVVGTGENSVQYPERPDLVVPGGSELPFETTYRPFTDNEESAGEERSGTVSLVQSSGAINSYGFSY